MAEGMGSKDVDVCGDAIVTGEGDVKFLVSVSGRVKVAESLTLG